MTVDDAVDGGGDGPSPYVVGIGASAGGLEALERFFSHVPPRTGLAFVVVQHLSPDHRSMMAELLGRHTSMPVRVIEHGDVPLPDTVSLIPPRMNLTLRNGRFHLVEKPPPPTLNLPIDIFFTSLAREKGEKAVAVVLSGTGSDGTRGVRAIREAGGFVLVQSPGSARFDGMPRSAIATGVVDVVGPPEEMPARLTRLAADGSLGIDLGQSPDSSESEALRRVIQLLHDDTGVNFSQYKATTVHRRIARRISLNQLSSAKDYLVLAQASPQEREALYRELLIGVTRFFRDRDVFDALRERVIRPLVAEASTRHPLRMWVAGCSSGEEAYTLAMLLNEEMELQGRIVDVKIFATDIDKAAVERASRGVYPESVVADIDHDRVARYFSRHGDSFEVSASLRQMILFAHHNMTRDPPFTKLDLVTCRNTLIYFDQSLQERVLGAFHFGLRTGGFLLLGTSETPGDLASHFAVVDAKHRIYSAIGPHLTASWLTNGGEGDTATAASRVQLARTIAADEAGKALDWATGTLLNDYAPAALLVDERFKLLHVFGDAGQYLRISSGAPQLDVLGMTHRELAAVLASGVPRAIRLGQSCVFKPVVVDADSTELAVRIIPFRDVRSAEAQALVVFEAPSAPTSVETVTVDPDVARQLAELHAELQHARDSQQALVEELETSNEELQATNQELLASNEELQATNEELQSVNEELHTVNAEFQQKIEQLERLSSDIDHLLASTDIGTLFLDRDLTIRKFTPAVRDLIPVLDRDIGRSVAHLANALGGQAFLDELHEVLDTGLPRERSIDSVKGEVLLRVLPYRVREIEGLVITFVNVTEVKRTYELAQRVLDALPAQVAFVGVDGTIEMVNHAWEQFAVENGGQPGAVGVGASYFNACRGDELGERVVEGIKGVLAGRDPVFAVEYPCDSPDERRWFVMQCTPTGDGNAVVVHFDVTRQKKAEAVLHDLATRDHLTGVLNRRGLDQQLALELDRVEHANTSLSALIIDCDDFKRVNERLGLAAGDIVLATVAQRIATVLRPGDSLARIGGDEFVVLLPDVRAAEAALVAERIRLAVAAQPVALSHDDIALTVSLALTVVDQDVRSLEVLLDRTRYALRTSKTRGKNRVTQAVSEGEGVIHLDDSRSQLVGLLGQADAMGVVAQPIVSLDGRDVLGYELLSRCVRPPYVPPAAYFQLAQEEGMLAVVDERCLRRCLEASTVLPPGLWRHVNLYPSTLVQFAPGALTALFADLDGGAYCIELSEQQLLGDPTYLVQRLAELRDVGVRIAIDDVGFGRTSLETLVILEPELAKIDRTYVRGVADDPQRQRWLRRLIHAADALGAELIAEGVENERDGEVLASLGVPYAQGFHLGPPSPLVGA